MKKVIGCMLLILSLAHSATMEGAPLDNSFPGSRGGWLGNRTLGGDVNDAMQQRFLEDIQIRQEQERQRHLSEKAQSIFADRSRMSLKDWDWILCHKDEPCLQGIIPFVVDARVKSINSQSLDSLFLTLNNTTGGDVAIFLQNNFLTDNDLETLKSYILNCDLKKRLVFLNVHANRFTTKGREILSSILEECENNARGYI